MFFKYISSFIVIVLGVSVNAQNWEELSSYPGPARHHPINFTLDGKGYLLTGSTSTSGITSDFYEYDPTTDSWTTLPNFPGSARSYAYGAVSDGKAYVGFGLGPGGSYLDDLWEYDPLTENWVELSSCPCTGRVHPTFVIEDQKIFLGLGGDNITGNLKDWWEYDIVSDEWRQLPDLPGLPRHHPFHFAVGGSVYTGLGHGNGPGINIYNDWYRWDLDTESWEQMNDFPDQGRVAGAEFNIGDRGFVLSGDGEDHGALQTGEFWEYNYQTDSWVELPPHPGVSRWAPGAFSIGNVVYFTSGEVRTGNPNAGLQNDLWGFDLDAILSINSANEIYENITLFPNPAHDKLFIKGEHVEHSIYQVFNGAGKLLLEGNYSNSGVDIISLNSGFYFITIQKDGVTLENMKFIKK